MSSPLLLEFCFENPFGPMVEWNSLDCNALSLPILALTSAPMMILLCGGDLLRRESRVSRKRVYML